MTVIETPGKVRDGKTEAVSGEDVPRRPDAPEAAPPKPVNPSMKVARFIAAAFVLALVWHAISDRYTPSTTRGHVAAFIAQVAPRVSGRVTEIDVADNTLVEAGAPMFTLEERPFRIAVETARAELKQAAQGIDASTAEIAAALAQAAQARAARDQQREDTDRTERLFEKGQVSKAQADQAHSALATAEASLSAAMAEVDAQQRKLGPEGADNPEIEAARLKLEQAEYDLTSTTVRAPSRGLVTNLSLAIGQYVNTGAPALTFVEIEDIWISAELRENQLGNVQPGDPVKILFDAVPDRIFEGKVASIAWGISPGVTESDGLPVNQPITQWFEPARRMPVRIELDGGVAAWPHAARVGGKVDVVVLARGPGNPAAWLALGMQRLRAIGSIFY